jgi:hypothetical protein
VAEAASAQARVRAKGRHPRIESAPSFIKVASIAGRY